MQSVPEKPIVFFDGYCVLCNHAANVILKHDKENKIYLASLQGNTSKKILKNIPLPDSIVLYDRGKIFFASDAVIRIGRLLGGIYGFSVLLLLIPKKLRNYVYNFIAVKRYSWFGQRAVCRMPDENEKAKFLD